MPSSRLLLSPVLAAALLLAGCGDDDDTAAEDPAPVDVTTAQTGSTSTTEAPTTAPGDDETTTTTGTDDGTATTQAAPTLQGCQDLPPNEDGVYQVAEAGEVEIRHEGDRVTLVEARPADGWTATGDTEDDEDEVDVEFRTDGREIDFEAEVDDGRLEIEICDD